MTPRQWARTAMWLNIVTAAINVFIYAATHNPAYLGLAISSAALAYLVTR